MGNMKETKHVLCDCCKEKIYLGEEAYFFDGYCGVFCSAECYANAHATVKVLDEKEADNCRCDILDEDTSCDRCIHFTKESTQYPCSHCQHCYTSKFELDEGRKCAVDGK